MSGMWHEARMQEKRIRGIMVDQHKRADRRKKYYEKVKAEPSDFVRINGNAMTIHLDSNIAFAAESPQTMMPWNGDNDTMIDRFDCRVHLDYIPKPQPIKVEKRVTEDRRMEYERYRVLVLNEIQSVSEVNFLKQIGIDEQFGSVEDRKPKKEEKKAAIGYVYKDSTKQKDDTDNSNSDAESELEEVDMDIAIDLNDLSTDQTHSLNVVSMQYGMIGTDYADFMHMDQQDLEMIKEARLIDLEKSRFAGRKCRKKRRLYKQMRLSKKTEINCIPSALMGGSRPRRPSETSSSNSSERSVSRSPFQGRTEFITSFGSVDDGGTQQQSSTGLLDLCVGPGVSQGPSSQYQQSSADLELGPRNRSRSKSYDNRSPGRSRRSRSKEQIFNKSPMKRSPIIKRYRRPSLSSSAPSDESSGEDTPKKRSYITDRNNKKIDKILAGRSKVKKNLTLREKLEMKMANQLHKTHRQDKRLQRKKEEKEYNLMIDRENELEDLNEEMYRIQKNRREKERSRSKSRSTSRSTSRSSSEEKVTTSRHRRSSSRDRDRPTRSYRSRSNDRYRRSSSSQEYRYKSRSRSRDRYRSRRSRSWSRHRRSRSPSYCRSRNRNSANLVDY